MNMWRDLRKRAAIGLSFVMVAAGCASMPDWVPAWSDPPLSKYVDLAERALVSDTDRITAVPVGLRPVEGGFWLDVLYTGPAETAETMATMYGFGLDSDLVLTEGASGLSVPVTPGGLRHPPPRGTFINPRFPHYVLATNEDRRSVLISRSFRSQPLQPGVYEVKLSGWREAGIKPARFGVP